jgi:hypothetical protein
MVADAPVWSWHPVDFHSWKAIYVAYTFYHYAINGIAVDKQVVLCFLKLINFVFIL